MATPKLTINSRGARNTKIWLGGEEITNSVRAFEIRQEAADRGASVKLELIIYDCDLEIEGELVLTEADESKAVTEMLKSEKANG